MEIRQWIHGLIGGHPLAALGWCWADENITPAPVGLDIAPGNG